MTMQLLSKLLENISGIQSSIPADLRVSGMTLDSRQIESSMLFVALKGTQTHGMDYARNAESLGAAAIIWESDEQLQDKKIQALKIPAIEIENLSAQLGKIAKSFYSATETGDGSQQNYGLKVVGITGTDGKTSVSHFFAQAMNHLGHKTAVVGTLGIGMPESLHKATHTTPDVITVHKTLKEIAQQEAKFVAMEVSSHALDQGRVDAVDIEVAVLTNLTRDHLDYHGTVEKYAEAKSLLFTRPELKSVVLNDDDAFGKTLRHQVAEEVSLISYSVKEDSAKSKDYLNVSNTRFTQKGIEAVVLYRDHQRKLETTVLGGFNLSNLLATLAAMLSVGVEFDEALESLAHVTTVPGRMEKIDASDVLVVVDYAHTPGALESVLTALQQHAENRLICVFGCGGDRDRGKRPLMAKIAEQLADVVIVTDDNPRTENPLQIIDEIMQGFDVPECIHIEHDRARAIRLALQQAKMGDVVLIAGKGHETVQILANKTEPFDDRKQAALVLQELAA